ncbi:SseB family protein [Gryllotalpicola protaetiae]|uniref:SseB family protein n=1 Tax=Gryllotalpicola protaetiae TaxID=2419771 RepID=A0A387BL08_9MICO|nr:SseB family protein [Gryllotalpicola protaetiae]AYG04553.1 SseB family protein [Gryllotalpicola protaetiae]
MSQGTEPREAHGAADSAGQPWAGRSFTPNTAAADDGSADPRLLQALTGFLTGTASPEDVVATFRSARLLIPLLAHAGEVETAPDGHLVDKTQELSIVTVAGPDGRKVLPAFTSVQTLAAWDPKARPVPAAGPRVALAAASEQTELIVIDPASPTEFVLRRPAVFALATGADWVAPYRAPAIRAAFERALSGESDAVGLELAAADPAQRLQAAELAVRLRLRAGLAPESLRQLVARLSERWAASPEIANGVDSLTLQLVSD